MREDLEKLLHLGMTPAKAAGKAATFDLCDRALTRLGAAKDRWSIWVPGRIEVFGKHTDYAGGRSLLCAVEHGFVVRAAARRDRMVRALDVARSEACETQLVDEPLGAASGWPHYVATVAHRLARNFPGVAYGVDLAFSSDLPVAAGLSSSSALMIATFIALGKANALRSSEAASCGSSVKMDVMRQKNTGIWK